MTITTTRIVKLVLLYSLILNTYTPNTWGGMFDIFYDSSPKVYFPLGEWRLGMSADSVQKLASVPFVERGQAPDILEASGVRFLQKNVRISFVFNENALTYSQLWLYEGNDKKSAIKAWLDLFDHLNKELGGVTIPNANIKGDPSREEISYLVNDLLKTSRQVVRKINARNPTKANFVMLLDMIPKTQPRNNRIHAQLMYSGIYDNYFVVLFEDDHGMPKRDAINNITLIPVESDTSNVSLGI